LKKPVEIETQKLKGVEPFLKNISLKIEKG
jgi:hypothetical protein